MSKRAEAAAYNYAKENGTLGYDYNQIYDAAKNGYEQAEKDLALTPDDMERILGIYDDMVEEGENSGFYPPEWWASKLFYVELLRRYNESK